LDYDVKHQQIISLNNEKYVLGGVFLFYDKLPDLLSEKAEALNLDSTMTTLNRALEEAFILDDVKRLCHNWNIKKPGQIYQAKRVRVQAPERTLRLSVDSNAVAHGTSIRYWLTANKGFEELTSAKLICLFGTPQALELFKTGDEHDYVYYCAVQIQHPNLPEGKDDNFIPEEIRDEWDSGKFPWGRVETYPVNLSIVSKYDTLSRMLYEYLHEKRRPGNVIMGIPKYIYTDFPSCPVPGNFRDDEGTIKVHNLDAFTKRLEMKKSPSLRGHMVSPEKEPSTGLRPAIDAANYRLFMTNAGPRDTDKAELKELTGGEERPWRIFMGGANWFKDIPPQFKGGHIVGRPLPKTEPQWLFVED
jgi:hypothetical protein